MVLKINSLARGFSGIRRKVIDALVALVNAGVYPRIPLKGSVGASGDLAPLAHMSLLLLGEGQARYRGQWMNAREALAGVAKNPPVVPVVSNVSVTPTSDPETIAARLVEQVTGRVRWRETVEWFGAEGVTTLYEIGAGKVLSGLARRINRDIAVANVGAPADVDAALASLG